MGEKRDQIKYWFSNLPKWVRAAYWAGVMMRINGKWLVIGWHILILAAAAVLFLSLPVILPPDLPGLRWVCLLVIVAAVDYSAWNIRQEVSGGAQ